MVKRARSKRFEVVCPGRCSGGFSNKVVETTPQFIRMTALQRELTQYQDGQTLTRCQHCGRVWRGEFEPTLGYGADILGKFDGPACRDTFVLDARYRQATPALSQRSGPPVANSSTVRRS